MSHSRLPATVAMLSVVCCALACKNTESSSGSTIPQDAGVVALPSDAFLRNKARTDVSPIEVIARPKEFSGQRIRTEGYLRMRDEDQMLYVSEEFARNNLGSSSIAIHAGHCGTTEESTDVLTKLKSLQERYVSITGKFVVGDPKVLTFQVGSLCDISAVVPMPTTVDPARTR